MAAYCFLTVWLFDAPREAVWDVIFDGARWPEWWPGVQEVRVLHSGDETGEGTLWRSTWRSLLPYTVEFDFELVLVEPSSLLVGHARGELAGTGTWRLYGGAAGTASTWEWDVETTLPWMKAFGPLGRAAFAWNHHAIMRRGAEGAARRIGCELVAAS